MQVRVLYSDQDIEPMEVEVDALVFETTMHGIMFDREHDNMARIVVRKDEDAIVQRLSYDATRIQLVIRKRLPAVDIGELEALEIDVERRRRTEA